MPKSKEQILAQKRAYHAAHREEKRAYHAAHREEHLQRMRAYYASNRKKLLAQKRDYYQQNSEQRRDYNQRYYHKNKQKLNANCLAYRQARRMILNAYRRAKYAEDPIKAREITLRYKATHPQVVKACDARKRARKRQVSINNLTGQQWEDIKAVYGHRCVYCGKKSKRLTQDHITPISKGGNHTLQNIVPACRSCNSKKRAGPPPVPVQPLLL